MPPTVINRWRKFPILQISST